MKLALFAAFALVMIACCDASPMPKRGDLLSLLNDRAGSIGRARYGKRATNYEPSLQVGDEQFDPLIEQKLRELISAVEQVPRL